MNTKALRVGIKATAAASALSTGAQAQCEFSLGIFGKGDHYCKLNIQVKFLNIDHTFITGDTAVKSPTQKGPGGADAGKVGGVEVKASVELFVSAS